MQPQKEQENPGQTGTDAHQLVQHVVLRLQPLGSCGDYLKAFSLGTDHTQNHIQVPQRVHPAPFGTGSSPALHAVGLGANGFDDHLVPCIRFQQQRATD